ncbi:hypothetical protein GCM10010497_25890 [Streptomyces cinereoruber]|uniref:Uncharacterized protein n=1 Tax=Streptomyces cinereoruber TaxID=67260 RepID=A0AAV4KG30_9ACTN|nr:hypothetical protein GCM10010497_25890 [Streptomyces cinereoruber]
MAMHTERPLRVPVGRDAERWRTFPGERTLVVAARTVVSTTRVLECLPAVLRDDSRVSVVFAYDPTSAFNDGVLDLLHDSGCRVMPWSQLGDVSPDPVLTASENVDLPEGTCPVQGQFAERRRAGDEDGAAGTLGHEGPDLGRVAHVVQDDEQAPVGGAGAEERGPFLERGGHVRVEDAESAQAHGDGLGDVAAGLSAQGGEVHVQLAVGVALPGAGGPVPGGRGLAHAGQSVEDTDADRGRRPGGGRGGRTEPAVEFGEVGGAVDEDGGERGHLVGARPGGGRLRHVHVDIAVDRRSLEDRAVVHPAVDVRDRARRPEGGDDLLAFGHGRIGSPPAEQAPVPRLRLLPEVRDDETEHGRHPRRGECHQLFHRFPIVSRGAPTRRSGSTGERSTSL